MAATGEVNNRDNTMETNLVKLWMVPLSSEVHNYSPYNLYMSPIIIADIQCQIRENNALVQWLREELRRSSVATSSLGPTSPSDFFYYYHEPSEDLLTSETSCNPEDSIFLQQPQVFWVLIFEESLTDLILVLALTWTPI